MFKAIEALLEKASLSITISAKDGNIAVTVIPKSKEGAKSISNVPLAISGTAEELDKEFVNELVKGIGEAVGFLSSAADFKAAAKQQEEAAKAEKNKPATPAVSTSKATPAKKLEYTKDQKAAQAKYVKSLAEAKKANDQDMINFHKNAIIKLYEAAKFDEADITTMKKAFDDIKIGAKADTDTAGDGGLFADKPAETTTEAVEEEKVETVVDADEVDPDLKGVDTDSEEEDEEEAGNEIDDDIF